MRLQQNNILISACLLGKPVRYNGSDLLLQHPLIQKWKAQNRLISICPEVAGGMPTPRAPAEITSVDKQIVIDSLQNDVSKQFLLGAKATLDLARENNCKAAIMTENSPSCGSNKIYNGDFSGTKVAGMGITSALLKNNGIRVFNQYQLDDIQLFLSKL